MFKNIYITIHSHLMVIIKYLSGIERIYIATLKVLQMLC